MAYPVCMACWVPLGHPAVMDVTEPKEIRAARERLGPRDQLQKERKKIRESLGPSLSRAALISFGSITSITARCPAGQKNSEGRKVRVELQDRHSFPLT